MGGVVALQVALAAPARVERLVLCGTSGGVDFGSIERQDWRPSYRREMPERTPRWFDDDRTDLTYRLGEINAPVLLVWGAEDRIVPPPAGALLQRLLPNARLVVIPGAGHDGPVTHAAEVATHIRTFLHGSTPTPHSAPSSATTPLPGLAPSPSRVRAGVRVSSTGPRSTRAAHPPSHRGGRQP
jgi:pimeloyl-ACP methyl ester carboxylesterase